MTEENKKEKKGGLVANVMAGAAASALSIISMGLDV